MKKLVSCPLCQLNEDLFTWNSLSVLEGVSGASGASFDAPDIGRKMLLGCKMQFRVNDLTILGKKMQFINKNSQKLFKQHENLPLETILIEIWIMESKNSKKVYICLTQTCFRLKIAFRAPES